VTHQILFSPSKPPREGNTVEQLLRIKKIPLVTKQNENLKKRIQKRNLDPFDVVRHVFEEFFLWVGEFSEFLSTPFCSNDFDVLIFKPKFMDAHISVTQFYSTFYNVLKFRLCKKI